MHICKVVPLRLICKVRPVWKSMHHANFEQSVRLAIHLNYLVKCWTKQVLGLANIFDKLGRCMERSNLWPSSRPQPHCFLEGGKSKFLNLSHMLKGKIFFCVEGGGVRFFSEDFLAFVMSSTILLSRMGKKEILKILAKGEKLDYLQNAFLKFSELAISW